MKSLHRFITRIEPPNWVMAIIAGIVLFRIPSFFEPYYYGDEMIYTTLGLGIRRGLTLYKQIFDNKPPLIYMTAALAGNLFWFKALLAFWMIATTICFWHLTENLFRNNKLAQKVSVLIFAIFTTIPLFEGNIVNAELFLIGPIILALTFLLTRPSTRNIFLAGIMLGVASLFKIPAAFDAPVIVVYWFITLDRVNFKSLVDIFKKTLILILGFTIPIILTFIWYFFRHATGDFFTAAFLQNVNYISSWNGGPQQSFVVKHGPLLIRAGIVLIGFIILRLQNRKLSKAFLIASIWLLTSLFAVTLSERPYPHYMIQAIPAISILIGILVSSPKFEQVLTITPLTLAIFVPVYYKFYYYSTSSYYIRFINFADGRISKSDYFNSFDKYTEGNYEVAKFLVNSTNKDDKIFIWGDTAPIIYSLARRLPPTKFVAAYHINDYSSRAKILNQLELDPPPFIVIPPNSPRWPELNKFVNTKYIEIYNQNNFTVWHLLIH
jgi:hypothetical protein